MAATDDGSTGAVSIARVADRAPACFRCRYDLSGLPNDGVCPECGFPVEESHDLRRAQTRGGVMCGGRRYVATLFAGSIGLTLSWIGVSITFVMGFHATHTAAVLAFYFLSVGAMVFGIWCITTPHPVEQLTDSRNLHNNAIRLLATLVGAGATLFMIIPFVFLLVLFVLPLGVLMLLRVHRFAEQLKAPELHVLGGLITVALITIVLQAVTTSLPGAVPVLLVFYLTVLATLCTLSIRILITLYRTPATA